MNTMNLPFRSEPFNSTIVIPAISAVGLALIPHFSLNLSLYILASAIVIYIIGFFTLFTFEAEEKFIVKKYLFRPFAKTENINYEDIYSIEVRKVRVSGELPYVIIHFNKEDERSIFFYNRSFHYDESAINFLIEAKNKGVKIKVKIDSAYKKDIDFLKNNLQI
jgi:hypothetical protein